MILWDSLLQLKYKLDTSEINPEKIYISFRSEKNVTLNDKPAFDVDMIIHVNQECDDVFDRDFYSIDLMDESLLEANDISLFKLYFPYTCMAHFGKKRGKSFTISHFAQTLDGRIASTTGDSKWIGNEENLIHAHRMRAMCDAILVGSKTIIIDNPRLNVRKVPGSDPTKVILGGNDQFRNEKFHAIDVKTIIFEEESLSGENYDCVVLPKTPEYDLSSVRKILANKGIYSVYIEGGSYTTSCFLKQNELDQVQLHFSSKILGSGTHSFFVDGITEIKESITFKSSEYLPMGSEIMFVGNIN